MSSQIIFSKKIITLFILAATFFSIGYFLFPTHQSGADVCFEIELSGFLVHGDLVGTDLYVLNTVVSVVDTTNGTFEDIEVGTGPSYSTLVNTDLYVVNTGSDDVSVIDTSTNTVTDTIPVGDRPRAATFANGSLYISNTDGDSVSVIDTSTNTVTDTIPVGLEPLYSLSVGVDNMYILNELGDTISVIDTSTNTVTNTITGFDGPRTFVLVGTDLYVTNNMTNTISVVDTNTHTITDTITVGPNPNLPILIGDDIYVGNVSDGSVSVIDTNTNTVTNTITGMVAPYYLSRVGTSLYVSDYNTNSVSVIDTLTNTIVDTIQVGTEPETSVLVGTDLYVFNYSSNNISVIDTLTNEVRDTCQPILFTAEIIDDVITVTYDEDMDEGSIPDASDFFVEVEGNLVAVTDVEVVGDTVLLTIATPAAYGDIVLLSYIVPNENPTQDLVGNNALPFNNQSVTNNTTSCAIVTVEYAPSSGTLIGNNLYINNSDSSSVSVIDTLTNEVIETISVGGAIYSVAVGTDVYVFDTARIYIIDSSTNAVVDTLNFPGYSSGVLVGTDLYLNQGDSGEVHVLDTLTNTLGDVIPVGDNPYSSVLVGSDVYVVNQSQASNSVSVIDTLTNTVTATILVGLNPFSGTLVGTDLYINNYSDASISVIDTLTNTVTDTINLPDGPHFSVQVGDNLYITQYNTSSITIVDTTNNTVTDTIDVGSDEAVGPYFLNAVNGLIYISNVNLNDIRMFDTSTNDLYTCQSDFTLTYTAGVGGEIEGSTVQIVAPGDDGTPVTAVPDGGYEFTGWSDFVNDNPRTDTNVLSSMSVTANFALESSEEESGGGGGITTGTTVHGRFRNFVNMGKFEEAYELIEEYPYMFTSENYPDFTFCDNASFTNFMKKKDVDGRYSAYYRGTVTEISKLQSFVNKLFMYQYAQASGPVDGIFGPLTKIGVERLQNLLNGAVELKDDLVIDGIVGPFTRSAVNDFCLPNNW